MKAGGRAASEPLEAALPSAPAADDEVLSYSGSKGRSGRRCSQLDASQLKPGAPSTKCTANAWRLCGLVFSLLRAAGWGGVAR